MIRPLIGALETERIERGGSGHAELFDDRLILPPPQELVLSHDIPTSSLVRLGMIKKSVKYVPFRRKLRQR